MISLPITTLGVLFALLCYYVAIFVGLHTDKTPLSLHLNHKHGYVAKQSKGISTTLQPLSIFLVLAISHNNSFSYAEFTLALRYSEEQQCCTNGLLYKNEEATLKPSYRGLVHQQVMAYSF